MYEVWEISVYPEGQVFLTSAGNGRRKEGFSWISGRHTEGVKKEFRTPSSPAAANLDAALNWLHEQGWRVISFVPAGKNFSPAAFWAITVPLDADGERIASVLEARRAEKELNQARNKALRPG